MSTNSIAAGLYPWLRPHYSQLSELFIQQKLHHGILVYGVGGLGKSQLALRLAEFIQCNEPVNQKSCGQCQSCRLHAASTHPDCYLIQVPADKSAISIEQIRNIQAKIVHTGLTNNIRVVIVNNAHLMTISAVNALLKVLEEPPKGLYFILTCSQRSLLPATIISRCLAIDAGVASAEKLAAWVTKQVSREVNTRQLALFNGSPLQALVGVESGFLEFVALLRTSLVEVLTAEQPNTLSLSALLGSKDVDLEQALRLIHLFVTDCTKLSAGVSINNSFELSPQQQALLLRIDVKELLCLEKELNQLRQLIVTQSTVNKLLQLERVIVNFNQRTLN
ncbi:MAG: hypothetical protein HRU24_08670 [Gammaproteobacteria bacterium]|nr:hypothetical protein [Gammaproteobacteria bacterium]